jgi:spermidine/putrescine transport system permease protein
MRKSRIPLVVTLAVMAFLYLPIFFLVVNSFNASRYASKWQGFSFRWYERLAEREDIIVALGTSLKIAAFSSVASMVLGTAAALALHRYRSKVRETHRLLVTVPLVLPDILMGMSLLLLFVALGVRLSVLTVTLAHITFCLSYVALVVLARLEGFDFTLLEAARDLGASAFQTFLRISLPLLAPGILAGGLLAFTLSIDDYVVTYFVKGPGADTLPTLVYSMIKKSKDLPVINALSSLMLVVTFATVAIVQKLVRRQTVAVEN